MNRNMQAIMEEQDDLLVLVAKYHEKVVNLKNMLRSMNQPVSDSDSI